MRKKVMLHPHSKTTLFGLDFDSQSEANRYLILRDELEAGKITDLQTHPKFELQPSFPGVRSITFSPDFMYTRDGVVTVEDVKPHDRRTRKAIVTEDFMLKWKIFQYQHREWKCEIV